MQYINEAICSIKTLFLGKNQEHIEKIVVYTDRPDVFECQLQNCSKVQYELITPEIIKDWVGANGYIYKTKIRVIQDFFSKYDGNVLFLDTDTIIIDNLSTVFHDINAGFYYMHAAEYQLSSQLDYRLYNFLLKDCNEELYGISLNSYMTNSGVIGMNSSNYQILNFVLPYIDLLYKAMPWQRVIEQIALGKFLTASGNLKFAHNKVLHYWAYKEITDFLIYLFDISVERKFSEKIFQHCLKSFDKDNLPVSMMEIIPSLGKDILDIFSLEYIKKEILQQSPPGAYLSEFLKSEISRIKTTNIIHN